MLERREEARIEPQRLDHVDGGAKRVPRIGALGDHRDEHHGRRGRVPIDRGAEDPLELGGRLEGGVEVHAAPREGPGAVKLSVISERRGEVHCDPLARDLVPVLYVENMRWRSDSGAPSDLS